MGIRNRRAVLQSVEETLVAAARRQAESAKSRRRFRGFLPVAVVGLTIAGSAMAAIGIVDPFSGHAPVEIAASSPPPLAQGRYPGLEAASPRGDRKRLGEMGSSTIATPIPEAGIVAEPESGPFESPAADQPAPAAPGEQREEPAASPELGGKAPIAGDKPTSPKSPDPIPGKNPPSQTAKGPYNTQTSMVCVNGFTEEVELGEAITCRVDVSGENSPGRTSSFYPTGTVTIESDGTGALSSDTCTLIVPTPGSGSTSSCTVEYTPSTLGDHWFVARYGGDDDDLPSFGNGRAIGI